MHRKYVKRQERLECYFDDLFLLYEMKHFDVFEMKLG